MASTALLTVCSFAVLGLRASPTHSGLYHLQTVYAPIPAGTGIVSLHPNAKEVCLCSTGGAKCA